MPNELPAVQLVQWLKLWHRVSGDGLDSISMKRVCDQQVGQVVSFSRSPVSTYSSATEMH